MMSNQLGSANCCSSFQQASFGRRLTALLATFASTALLTEVTQAQPDTEVLPKGFQPYCAGLNTAWKKMSGGFMLSPYHIPDPYSYSPESPFSTEMKRKLLGDAESVKAMGAKWVRFQMNAMGGENIWDLPTYTRWLEEQLDFLDNEFLPDAQSRGLKVIVDLHSPYRGWHFTKRKVAQAYLFEEENTQKEFLHHWGMIAQRLHRWDNIIYDFNEPQEREPSPSVLPWKELVKKVLEAIREHDKETTFLVSPPYGGAEYFPSLLTTSLELLSNPTLYGPLAFTAHFYPSKVNFTAFDGSSAVVAPNKISVLKFKKQFKAWKKFADALEAKGFRPALVIGEIGVPVNGTSIDEKGKKDSSVGQKFFLRAFKEFLSDGRVKVVIQHAYREYGGWNNNEPGAETEAGLVFLCLLQPYRRSA